MGVDEMLGIESFYGSIDATVTIGLVFIEALALYVSYGAITRTVGSPILDSLRGN